MPRVVLAVLAAACSACADRSVESPGSTAPRPTALSSSASEIKVVEERFVTASDPAANIDSVATHTGQDGGTWLFATAKGTHVIRVYDAASGERVRDIGGSGAELGRFSRPNGVVALDGLLVVVERDNRRVQIFSVPQLEPIAVFGDDALVLPYGAYLRRVGGSRYELYVTDAYETADEQVPPDSELDRRVHLFQLDVARDSYGSVQSVDARHVSAFGETSGPGVLRVVESIWGDPVHDRLLIAEEDPAGGRVIKVYSFDGRFKDEIVGNGVFDTQPEGIALYECEDGGGYWLTTDQSDSNNVFHVFERRSLEHIAAFRGRFTSNTDGVWLTRDSLDGMPDGAFFAVHDDQAVAAFDWRDIMRSLRLAACDG